MDWARLAQQWIMMKETVPPSNNVAPEKPQVNVQEEGGEAPMDIGKDDDEPQNEGKQHYLIALVSLVD